MTYIIAIILSLVSCLIGFGLEVVQGNIRHVQNGRKPEAGAAIFPTIVLVPLFYVAAMWLIDRLWENFGFYAVLGYFLIAGIWKLVSIKRLNLELAGLVAAQERVEEQPANHSDGSG